MQHTYSFRKQLPVFKTADEHIHPVGQVGCRDFRLDAFWQWS